MPEGCLSESHFARPADTISNEPSNETAPESAGNTRQGLTFGSNSLSASSGGSDG